MHLSLIDAFGASAAPGAPPPGVSALEGGTAGNGNQDAGFATLLDAAAGSPAADTAEADTTGIDGTVPAAGAIDPTLVSALHAKWWLTALTTTEAAVPPEQGSAGVGDGDEASIPAGTAPDPDDEAVAEWFIAAGADLTALVVVEDVSATQAQQAREAAASAAVDTPALEGDRTAQATASTDEAITSRGQHGAGVPASNLTAAGQSNGVPSAAQAPGWRDAAGEAAGTSGGQAAVARADNNNAGESNPGANGPDGLPPGGIERQRPPEQASDRLASNASSAAGELPAPAAEVAKAVADLRETAQRGAEVAALASAEGQARAEDRRSSMAAARLANSIERGGGATSVATGTAPGAADPDSTDPVSAAQPVDLQSQSEAGSEDQPSESREGRFVADAQAPPAPARAAAGVTAGEVTVVSSGQPALTASAPAMAAAPGVPVSSTATPDAGTLPQLVQAIRLQVRAGGGDAVVRLNPEHLGAVSISLRVERGVVSATVHAESPAVRQWLEEHESSLRDGLSGHGLFLDRFVVQRDGRQPEQRHSEDQPRYRRRTPRRQAGQEQATFEVRV